MTALWKAWARVRESSARQEEKKRGGVDGGKNQGEEGGEIQKNQGGVGWVDDDNIEKIKS